MTTLFYLTLVVFLCLCLVFALLILIQKGRGGGISSAFGGAGGNTAFGSKTGDVLTWATSVVFFLFLLMCVGLNLMANRVNAQQIAAPGRGAGVGAREAGPSAAPAPATTAPAASRPADVAGSTAVPVLPPTEQPAPPVAPATRP